MARLIDQAGPFRLRPEAMGSAFQTLLGAIVNQQLSGQAAATILGRVVALCGGRRQLRPQAILNLSGAALRGAGLSRAKVLAVQDLAARTLEGTVPGVRELRRLDDAQIVERLTAVRGIGVWSVEMLLIFRLGRPDVLPVSDLGVRKGVQLTYGGAELPSPREVLARGERWRPYRSVASWYLWRAVDLSRR
jgi:DNA-3-methyladenine glycosylase II